MDLINFDTNKSLEALELNSESSERRSIIVSRGNPLRKKAVKDITLQEMRVMIAQNSSLKFLVPLAIAHLNVNSLVKGDTYEGDLLNAVLTVEKKFWSDGLIGCVPTLEAIVEIALAAANANPKEHVKFLQNSTGAINIFKTNVGLI